MKKLVAWLRHRLSHDPQNPEELMTVLRKAAVHNIVDNESLRMMEGALQVANMKVRDIMVPRSQMIIIESNTSLEQLLPIAAENQHSRYPVIGENRDEILGVLLVKDLLPFLLQTTKKFDLIKILRPAIFIPESKRLNVLLNDFRENHHHMAIVVDEYGGISGLVTIEDVLEEIVGEIEDESDTDDPDTHIKKIAEFQYSVKSLTSIDLFNSSFNCDFSTDEFDTIGGLIMNRFGHMPKRGESLTINQFRFKILHADNRRIRLLKVTVHPEESENE